MEKIISVLKSIYEFVAGLSIEHITLLSVLVTLVIFVFDKRKDTKNAQLEARREQYKKFIQLLQKFSTGKVKLDEKARSEFFDAGVSLLLYGSKKVYKKYVFFREYTTNPVIQKSKHNQKEVLIYVIADILKAIRHEVGLTSFGELSSNEALAFFVNDIGMNSASKVQAYHAKYHNSIFIPSSIWRELFRCYPSPNSPYTWQDSNGTMVLRFERFISPTRDATHELYIRQPILFRWVCESNWLEKKLKRLGLKKWQIHSIENYPR